MSFQLCAVCCFEDRGEELDRAQAAYAEHGVVDPTFAELARAPHPDEAPPPWFRSRADERVALAELVERAFADVTLDGGVCLDEAEQIDDYELPARTNADPPPAEYAVAPPWQDLSRADLERFVNCNFPFQDGRGLRYHLPAYVRLFLTDELFRVSPEWLVYTLESGHQLDQLEALLTDDQAQVVARWLAWMLTEPEPYTGKHCRRALERHWGRHLDPEHRAWLLGR